jgi:hypothetical protein
MRRKTSLFSIFATLFIFAVTAAQANEARAQIKCFANLSYHLFDEDLRKKYPQLERDRQKHLRLGYEAGKRDFRNAGYDISLDFFLGGYVERVYKGQVAKIQCNNPNHYMDYCSDWSSQSTQTLSRNALKFYERENCKLLLR